MHVCVCACVCMCMSACVRVHVFVSACVYVYECVRVHVCTCVLGKSPRSPYTPQWGFQVAWTCKSLGDKSPGVGTGLIGRQTAFNAVCLGSKGEQVPRERLSRAPQSSKGQWKRRNWQKGLECQGGRENQGVGYSGHRERSIPEAEG